MNTNRIIRGALARRFPVALGVAGALAAATAPAASAGVFDDSNRVRAPRRLARARYRLTAVATDAAGNASAPARVGFRMRAAHH